MSAAEEIKSKIDIAQYIEQYVPLKKSGRYYKANCPFHSERTPSFVVNTDTQSWRCFGACAEGGDLFNFAMKMHGWTFSEALHELGAIAGVEVRKQTPEQKQRNEYLDRLRGLLQTAADYFHNYLIHQSTPNADTVLAYVREERGFSDETIKKFQVGYAPASWNAMLEALKELGYSEAEIIEVGLASQNDKGRVYDRFRNRLIIPIRDDRGRVVGFGARALHPEDTPKYLNSPQTPVFDKSRLLFGLDMAKSVIRDSETAVIVEGYMDVIQAHQAGFMNVVAQMGTAITEPQLRLIAPRFAKKIVMALDADEAGQSATRRSLEVARGALQADYAGRLSVDIRILQIPDAKDPDDFLRESPEQWGGLVESAQPVAEFVIGLETAELSDKASVQEREAVIKRVLPILLASEDNLYRGDNLQKLALRLRMSEEDLLAWARRQQQQQQRFSKPSPRTEAVPPPDETIVESSDVAKSATTPSISLDHWLIEADCLRLLLLNPEYVYQVNRKFRELAANDGNLLVGPLSALDVDDFTHSDYRALVEVFYQGLMQDEFDLLDYVHENLPPELAEAFEVLLLDEPERVHKQVANRYAGDMEYLLEQRDRQSQRQWDDENASLIAKALFLRSRRLNNEGQELYFLQRQDEVDVPMRTQFAHQHLRLMTAIHRINVELHTWSASI